MDDCLSSRLIDYNKQFLDDPVTLIKQYLHRMSVLLRRQYSGPHCLDRKRAFLRYTLSGHPDRDTLAARLVCWLALVCRPDFRYIPFAG